MKNHWSGLTVFVDHPWVPMDNNVAERAARLPVVGRKNFYGSGSNGTALRELSFQSGGIARCR